MPKYVVRVCGLCLLLASVCAPVFAGVIVTQNVFTAPTNWPGTPVLSTMANPLSNATVPQSFTNASRTRLAQTFTITGTNYTLDRINIYAGGGSGTDAGTNLTLRLYDLGFQTAPQPAPYSGVTPNETISGDLLGSGNGLALAYSNQPNGILQLDFTDADRVLLELGHMYAFELGGTAGQRPMNWMSRTSGSTYSGGAAYTNRYWLNGGSSAGEFAMAVYGTAAASAPAPSTLTAECTVAWTNTYQRIDGFGASSAWRGSWTTAQGDMFFSTNTGIGLSLLRIRIRPSDGGTDESSIMQMARDRGARIWSTPWTPPTAYKSVNSSGVLSLNGGNYLGGAATNQAYANYLASHVARMSSLYGVNLYAISIQNEPDVNTTGYESCQWSGAQIRDFVPFLAGALAASNVAGTKIMLPESQHWSSNPGLFTAAMSEPSAATNVSIIANHNYDGINADNTATSTPTQINAAFPGKSLWETEVSALKGSYSSIYNGVYWAGRIHAFMTVAQANAWHHWWLIAGNNTANQGLLDVAGNPTKRMYAMGHFSRFVRPGFLRIGVMNSGSVLVSAYKELDSGKFAIVAINPNAANPVDITVNINDLTAGSRIVSVTPWLTSSSLSLASQNPVTVSNNAFSYRIPGPGIATFVGQATTNNPPTLLPVENQAINPGALLVVTNVAVDPDGASQTLTFSGVNLPPGATVDSSSGVFSWRPLMNQAGSTNVIQVRVTDNGVPNLNAAAAFSVAVSPISPATIQSINASETGIQLIATGMAGPDYTLLSSTNLVDWQEVFTTNSPQMPMTLTISEDSERARFYRLELGP